MVGKGQSGDCCSGQGCREFVVVKMSIKNELSTSTYTAKERGQLCNKKGTVLRPHAFYKQNGSTIPSNTTQRNKYLCELSSIPCAGDKFVKTLK